MNELIKITEKDGQQVVSARELHHFLESKRDFSNWIKDRIEKYGFVENQDYEVFNNFGENPHGGRPLIEYALTIDTAKELAMVEGNEKGKQARQYFIAMEKKAKQLALNVPQNFSEALKLAYEQSLKIEEQQKQLQIQAPKVIFADAVSTSKTSILVGEMAKILKQNGIDIGQNRFFEWLRNNGYLITRNGSDFNMPTQKSMDLGLFEIKETSITHSDGHISVNKTPKVTGKGQVYFVNKFLKKVA